MSKRTTCRTAAALALAGTLSVGLSACGGGSDDSGSGEKEKIAGAGKGGDDSSKSPSPGEGSEPGAPTFDLPSDVTLKFDVPKTGEKAKDEVLRDVVYSTRASQEAYGKGSPGTANMIRYWKHPALSTVGKDVKRVHDEGLTITGRYLYYDFKVADLASKEAWVTFCESQRNGYGKEIKGGEVLKTKPTKKDFVLHTLGIVKNGKGDWQAVQVKTEKGVARCAR
ncbi:MULTISPECIES: hypothetical protein [unclassified Streptomyces]|uniref:hypothetical protein n=1 Tax=unclassified Streptomyces TaxID=2593676 RepID=UPI002DDC70F7|nr:hypothetical protein [Streptomyces sp. NBC_01775]WSB78637.1 hypothetical protein OHB04_24650 [Streptomyces sp. NBC_01775]WSS41942.1 hypothetical protein OG220_16115 [Streptomyces sp. NBC_01187]